MRAATTAETADWRDRIFAELKAADIRQVGMCRMPGTPG